MSLIFTAVDNVELACLVRSFPSLWNYNDPLFWVNSRRGSPIWITIGEHFSCTGKSSRRELY